MKKIIVLIGLVAVVLSGVVGALLIRQLQAERERTQVAAAAAAAEAAVRKEGEQRLAEVERDRAHLEVQKAELVNLARQSEAQSASNIAAPKRLGTPTNGGAQAAAEGIGDANQGMGSMLQKMMKDPAMKEMIRTQHKTLMKTMYGPLFKDLNLPADQQKQLTDLLLDAQMGNVDSASEMFSADGAVKTNAIAEVKAREQSSQEQIKALLGEEKYAVYDDYRKSMSDRMVLNQFQQQNDGTEVALRDEQLKQLVQVMKEERARIPAVLSDDPAKAAESMSQLMNTELMDQQFKWQEDFGKRVSDRAGQILSPEQLKEFSDFQTQQMNMQKLGMKMAREMFKPGAGANAPPTPTP